MRRSTRHISRTALAGLGALTLVAAAAAPAGASTDTTTEASVGTSDDSSTDDTSDSSAVAADENITVTDYGDESETVVLRVAPKVGDNVTMEMSIETSISGPQDISIPFDVTLDAEVTEATADGYTVRNEVLEAGSSDSDMDSVISDIVGVSFVQEYDASGVVVATEIENEGSLSPTQKEFATSVSSSTTASLQLPSEPVGVGATWDAVTTVATQGIDVQPTYHYELVSIDGEMATITNNYDIELDESDVSGTLTGEGTITVSLTNALDIDMTANQDGDLEAMGQSAQLEINVELVSEPVA